ncbi:hypothetical protein B7463_g7338, partial [Scytalidium lignicola]
MSADTSPPATDLAEKKPVLPEDEVVLSSDLTEHINASGHPDQLNRQYGILSICGMALTVDNAWVVIGSSLTVSIFNGGPPGVLYEFLVAAFYYGFIASSLAEMASSVPSSGGVYHWATLAPGPKYGRILGFYAGSLNFFGWLFDLASIAYIMAELVVQMYAIYHPNYVIKDWQLFVAFLLITWLCVALTVFFNSSLPYLQQFGLFVIIVGGIATIIVLAAMPKTHASNSFVWSDWENNTGWNSGVAFLTGVLNGAFTIGTPDSVTHMAEEVPHPRTDLPKAIAAQIILGTVSAFLFVIALFYGITDLDAVLNSNGSFPLAEVFAQATGSTGATFGLLFIVFLSLVPCLIGTFLTVGRTWWALARDNATPFSHFFSSVNESLSCPIPATLFTGIMTTAFGAITMGSHTAFSDLAGSFIILTGVSYAIAIGAHLFSGRKNLPQGPFWLGRFGPAINLTAFVLVIFFSIMYCFPFSLPAETATMNYNSVILVGIVFLTTVWWFVHGRGKYTGPKLGGFVAEGRLGDV